MPPQKSCPALSEQAFLFFRIPNQPYAPLRSATGMRGVRVVTNVERNAVDVLALTDERRNADGEVVWSWRAHAGVKLATVLIHRAGDGGKQAGSPGRARSKP